MHQPFALKDIGRAREAIRAVFPELKTNVGDMMDGLLSARLQTILIDEEQFLKALKSAFYAPKEAELQDALLLLNEGQFALYVRLIRPKGIALKAKEAISFEKIENQKHDGLNW